MKPTYTAESYEEKPHPFVVCPRCKGPLKVIVAPKKDLTCPCGYRASIIKDPNI